MNRALVLVVVLAAGCSHQGAPTPATPARPADPAADKLLPPTSATLRVPPTPTYSTVLAIPCAVTGGRTVTCIRNVKRTPHWLRQRLGDEFGEGEAFVHLAWAEDTVCGLVRPSGKVLCWQLDGSAEPDSVEAATVAPIDNAIDVARMKDATCGLTEVGAVHCWGDNESGQLGNGSHDPVAVSTHVDLPAPAIDIEAGGNGACALLATRSVYCWGGNPVAGDPRRLRPTKIRGLDSVRALESTQWARLADGTWRRWLEVNYIPKVGFTAAKEIKSLDERRAGTECWIEGSAVWCRSEDPKEPQQRLGNVADFDEWLGTFCARQIDGSVWCWGSTSPLTNAPPTADVDDPTRVSGLAAVERVSLSERGACAVHDGGQVSCWGRGPFPSMPDQIPEFIGVPTRIALSGPASDVLTARTGGCALVEGGAQCWSAGDPVRDLGPADSLATYADLPCAVTAKGTTCLRGVFAFRSEPEQCTLPPSSRNAPAWRYGNRCRYEQGELRCESGRQDVAFDATEAQRAPCRLTHKNAADLELAASPPLRQLRGAQLLVGGGGVCRLDRSGRLECTSFQDAPRRFWEDPFEPQSGIIQASVGAGGVCAVREDGEVRCWGQIAPDSPSSADPGINDAVAVDVGGTSACAIRKDRTLWCWGAWQHGERGLGGEAWIRSKLPIRIDSLHQNAEQASPR